MTKILHCLLIAGFLTGVVSFAKANDEAVLAKRGDGVVTHDLFDARVYQIPPESRQAVIQDQRRLREMLGSLLLQQQLVYEARQAGYDKDPEVMARMKYAQELELAMAWRQHYPTLFEDADYEQMAREDYQLQKGNFYTPERIDVYHVLIKDEERTSEEALEIAQEVERQLREDPDSVQDLVARYSEDPSAASNKGYFTGVKRGEMVKPFEDAAFGLKPGEISEPVKTQYGYHVIGLVNYHEPKLRSFEDVKPSLIARVRKQHRERLLNDHLSELTSLDVEMSEEDLTEMVRRHFGDEVLAE